MKAHKNQTTKRAAIYTRKSTSAGLEQDFNSLDAQRDSCTAYIQRQPGWTLVGDSYDDGGFTGANIERPAFQRLLADIEAGKIDVVVVYKLDRLSRSLLDFVKVMERFNAAGASFVSVTQAFSTADAMGRLTLNMLMSFAEFEREMIADRTRDKIAGARRKGKWTGGPRPLGYQVVDKRLVVDELEAVVVREIFSLYLEQRSALAVSRLLNERQRSTKRHRSINGTVREGHGWSKNDVLRILKNPVYAGYMRSRLILNPKGPHWPSSLHAYLGEAGERCPIAGVHRFRGWLLRSGVVARRCGLQECVADLARAKDTFVVVAPIVADEVARVFLHVDQVLPQLRLLLQCGQPSAHLSDERPPRQAGKECELPLNERQQFVAHAAGIHACEGAGKA
jgi:DNA invertase Pin-like site-specific DNA recombinase